MGSHREIEDRAAEFLARRDGGHWSPRDQAQLEAWLDEATAHRVAFLRLETAWEDARRLKALSAGLAPGNVPAPGVWKETPFFDAREREEVRRRGNASPPPRSPRRWRYWGASLAAGVVLAIIGTGAWYLWPAPGDRYSTPVGGTASVPLQDGSKLTLNTASKVTVELTPNERHINLERGEAYFEVAKDPQRPFVVQVGDKRVVAVGTKFSVSREGDDVRVVVTEGTVRLESAPARPRNQAQHGGAGMATGTNEPAVDPRAIPLTAGTIARASEDDVLVQNASVAQAEEALSWRAGYLTFHETTLADAVAEFNRYNTHRIRIDDPAVAAIRISGTFRPTNYEAFVRLLHQGFSIKARSSGDTTTLARN